MDNKTVEQKKDQEYYPGIQYQRLFDAISNTNGISMKTEMDDIIKIVHEDFPVNQSPATGLKSDAITFAEWLNADFEIDKYSNYWVNSLGDRYSSEAVYKMFLFNQKPTNKPFK